MSNRTYLCTNCGALCRASVIYFRRKETAEEAKASLRWPKHCGQPMKTLSYTQGVAATHIDDEQRVAWAKQGLYILQRGGKRKWVAALNARHVEQAKQQYAAFLERQA